MKCQKHQKGIAVILAILITTIAVSLSTLLIVRIDQWLNRNAIQQNHAQTRELAKSGVDYALAILHDDTDRSAIDHLGESWARRLPPIAAEGGEIEGYIEDAQGKLNLNNLLLKEKKSPKEIEKETQNTEKAHTRAYLVYQRLLEVLDLDPKLADTLTDWIDNDDEASPNGAESAYYLTLQPPHDAANMFLNNFDTLLRVKNYDQATLEKLREFVSVLPEGQAINVNTAPAEVLVAAIGGLSLAQAREIVKEREDTYYRNVNDFKKYLGENQTEFSIDAKLSTSTHFFLVHLIARYENITVKMNALVQRENKQQFPKILWLTTD